MITQDRLKELVEYDPLTGKFIALFEGKGRVEKYRIKKGQEITGSLTGKYYKTGRGYLTLYLDRKPVKAHHAAWIYVNGAIPEDSVIDHINGITTDNRIANLRVTDNYTNRYNINYYSTDNIHVNGGVRKRNATGLSHITYDGNRYRVRICRKGYKTVDKHFKILEEAIQFRDKIFNEPI